MHYFEIKQNYDRFVLQNKTAQPEILRLGGSFSFPL